jgi:hypothetical protein
MRVQVHKLSAHLSNFLVEIFSVKTVDIEVGRRVYYIFD